jgi:hypothetical protein
LREILDYQIPQLQEIDEDFLAGGEITYASGIGSLMQDRCGNCHGENGQADLNLTSYQGVLDGGESGPAVTPGDPDNSLLVLKYSGEVPHFGQLAKSELNYIIDWIAAGAP